MVRMRMAVNPIDDLAEALRRAYPELDSVCEASEDPVYLVGGAVRDLLLGLGRSDIDLVVIGDAAELAARLGVEAVEHERFATVKARLDGHEIDIATARAELYPRPGALPEIEPADDVEKDLARRDFTINAMAVPLRGEPKLVDPYGGRADLEAGLLRVLHPRSFADDPTRALRAARYAARFGLELEAETEALLRGTDLTTVSDDRRLAELRRLAAETSAVRGFELLEGWELVEPRTDGSQLAGRVTELLAQPPWNGAPAREKADAVLAAALGTPGDEEKLALARPQQPSAAVEMARGHSVVELILARALGAEWLDRYMSEWRLVTLEIDGGDQVAAGVPEGPSIGRGLHAALRAKLDGELSGRETELATALAAAWGTAER